MIYLGLTTWSDHPDLLAGKKPTLAEYASKLPLVEIDTSFYAIPSERTVASWVEEVPKNFYFVIKANKAMTLHEDWQVAYESEEALFKKYLDQLSPLLNSGKLGAILFQFPPYFACTKENVEYLKKIRKIFKDYQIALEFRNNSWYNERIIKRMLDFMKKMQFVLVNTDEPQIPNHSVPFITEATNKELAVVRLHGRNQQGWLDKSPDWRKKRTLYRYNQSELTDLANKIKQIQQQVKDVFVIFNNNSGGDAAQNALQLKELLQLDYQGLNPEQLDLFDI